MYMPYEMGPIRPPSEARSLLIRVTRNCAWNKCTFCPVYKGTKFEFRNPEDVKKDVRIASEVYGDNFSGAFLQDSDSLIETNQTCYQVGGIYSPPIQLLCSGAKASDFERVLSPLNHGWLATTALPTEEIMIIFAKSSPFLLKFSEDVDLIFIGGKPSDISLERKLVQRFASKTMSVVRFMLQMKMSEVKFACKAFLDEIYGN